MRRITQHLRTGALFCLMVLLLVPARAEEGMWLPLLLKQLVEGDMRDKGLKLTAEQIYSVNEGSLKDGVAIFGNGCTCELISGKGLVLTNYHCGFGRIQSHSSVDNDYITEGFWAKDGASEMENPGLTVTFIRRIEDVTGEVLAGISESTPEAERERLINQRIEAIAARATQGSSYGAFIRPFYYGNEYYLFLTETFRDIRLVGAPPQAIGEFGGDTDNWMWPRHTGDFALFRIYAAPDGTPADYSEANVPYAPEFFFPISIRDKSPEDFTMVLGFPGSTQEYLPSYAVENIITQEDPIRIRLREERLKIMDAAMAANDTIRIQYASKQSGIENGYKKWKGEIRGLLRADALAEKKAYEEEFQSRIGQNDSLDALYGDLLPQLREQHALRKPFDREMLYLNEAGFGIEAVVFALRFRSLAAQLDKDEVVESAIEQMISDLRGRARSFFKDYSETVDRPIAAALLRAYTNDLPRERWPRQLVELSDKYDGNWFEAAEAMYETSIFTDATRMDAFLDAPKAKDLLRDPIYKLMQGFVDRYRAVQPQLDQLNLELDQLNRRYMAAQRLAFTENTFYPDANFTLRLTYGKIDPYRPDDGVIYQYHTTLGGVMEKAATGLGDYRVPNKLVELYERGDWGRYGQDGELWTCFIASNHTSGGNSGSPVIDGEGRLIGLNFDRNWEGTMSDIYYDPSQCRNISVDVRYILFLIDRFAEADYLLEEMEIVE